MLGHACADTDDFPAGACCPCTASGGVHGSARSRPRRVPRAKCRRTREGRHGQTGQNPRGVDPRPAGGRAGGKGLGTGRDAGPHHPRIRGVARGPLVPMARAGTGAAWREGGHRRTARVRRPAAGGVAAGTGGAGGATGPQHVLRRPQPWRHHPAALPRKPAAGARGGRLHPRVRVQRPPGDPAAAGRVRAPRTRPRPAGAHRVRANGDRGARRHDRALRAQPGAGRCAAGAVRDGRARRAFLGSDGFNEFPLVLQELERAMEAGR